MSSETLQPAFQYGTFNNASSYIVSVSAAIQSDPAVSYLMKALVIIPVRVILVFLVEGLICKIVALKYIH